MRKKILLYNKLGIKIFKFDETNFYNINLSYNLDDVIFYLNLNGIITINNIFLFKDEGICLKNNFNFNNLKKISNKFSGIIYIIKKDFFSELNLNLDKNLNLKFNFYSYEFINLFREINIQDFQIYFSIINLSILLNKNSLKFNPMIENPYIKYKKNIIEIIEKNIKKRGNKIVEIICNNINISIPTCYKIFKLLFGETPQKYINKKKLTYGYLYLEEKNKTIEEIAQELNYSKSIFKKNFFEHYGNSIEKFKIKKGNEKENV